MNADYKDNDVLEFIFQNKDQDYLFRVSLRIPILSSKKIIKTKSPSLGMIKIWLTGCANIDSI